MREEVLSKVLGLKIHRIDFIQDGYVFYTTFNNNVYAVDKLKLNDLAIECIEKAYEFCMRQGKVEV